MDTILDLCKASKESGTGVTLWFGSHSVSIVVTKVHGLEYVEGHNQMHSRVVVLTSKVIAAAAA